MFTKKLLTMLSMFILFANISSAAPLIWGSSHGGKTETEEEMAERHAKEKENLDAKHKNEKAANEAANQDKKPVTQPQ